MRKFWMALILILPVSGSALGQMRGSVGEVVNKMNEDRCKVPDGKLIKPGTTDQYNAQAKGFNDCLRIYVESENNKITRIRADANVQFDQIMQSATSQIHDIERAINTAIVQAKIVNEEADASALPPPATSLAAFPDASCKTPDAALLKPARGKRVASLANLDRHEDQRLAFEACTRSYIAQAKNEIRQIKANAEDAFLRVAAEANPRITEINNNVSQALADASKASGERDAKTHAFHSPLAAGGLAPAVTQAGGALGSASLQTEQKQPSQSPPSQIQALQTPVFPKDPGTESVTVTGERLPRSGDMPSGEGDPDAISCRAPQQLTGSRLWGPEVCKHNRDWAKITKAGMNLNPEGTQMVNGERQRTLNPLSCTSQFNPARPEAMVTTCLGAQ